MNYLKVSDKKKEPKLTKEQKKKQNHQTIVCHILEQSKNVQEIFKQVSHFISILTLHSYRSHIQSSADDHVMTITMIIV